MRFSKQLHRDHRGSKGVDSRLTATSHTGQITKVVALAAATVASILVWQSALNPSVPPLALAPQLPGFATDNVTFPPPERSALGSASVYTVEKSILAERGDHPAAAGTGRTVTPKTHASANKPTSPSHHRPTSRRSPPTGTTQPAQPPATGSQPAAPISTPPTAATPIEQPATPTQEPATQTASTASVQTNASVQVQANAPAEPVPAANQRVEKSKPSKRGQSKKSHPSPQPADPTAQAQPEHASEQNLAQPATPPQPPAAPEAEQQPEVTQPPVEVQQQPPPPDAHGSARAGRRH